ncbi:DUF3108 domain-containing protein [Oricola sp.]|uniref:DUF3108 domain-containing protein n=1 Tax=Oricola sp. TaxID=1979950 RepID=UPI003BAC3771
MRAIAAALIACMLVLPAGPAAAEPHSYVTDYTISALGLRIGKARFRATIGDDEYTMRGKVRSAGIVNLFAKITGTMNVTGKIGQQGADARDYRLNYVSGDDKQHTEIDFENGTVIRTLNDPEVRKKADWVAVKPEQLAGIADPFSASLIRAGSRREVCGRTLRVYDGALVAEMRMSYLRTVPFYTKGYRGDAVTCLARFVPVAGYPGRKKEFHWMRDKSRIEISFAPVGKASLYAPVSAVVGTQIGKVRLRATRFGTAGKD